MIKTILVVAALVVFVGKDCAAKYEVKGDHFGNTDDANDCRDNLEECSLEMARELSKLLSRRNPDDIVAKYTEDVVYVKQGRIAFGREAVKKFYQELFDSGVYGSKITILGSRTLGDDYIALLATFAPFDVNQEPESSNTVLAVLRKVDHGYQTYLKMEYENKEVDDTI